MHPELIFRHVRTRRRPRRATVAAVTAVVAALLTVPQVAQADTGSGQGPVVSVVRTLGGHTSPTAPEYTNPLKLALPGGFSAASCADPDVTQADDHSWYLFCTSDRSTDAPNGPNIGLLPIYHSTDLIHWSYLTAAFPAAPSYAKPGAGIWAPNIVRRGNEYRLYFAVSDTTLPGNGSAIGVAVGPTPAGPFVVQQTPVVEPADSPMNPGQQRWTLDPEVVAVGGTDYLFYGSFFGGLSARQLSADGRHSDSASMVQIATDNRYEGAYVVHRGGWWYLLASSTNCCNGPLTGYSLFAARSHGPLGPYVDRYGRSVLDSRVGGTPVVAQNGNRWVGVGHNTMLTDEDGQDWMIYHAVDRHDPYYLGANGYTKRPALIDAVDWIGGWPAVNSGSGPSEGPEPGPVAAPGQRTIHRVQPPHEPRPGAPISSLSDEFSGTELGAQWTWIRPEVNTGYSVGGGEFTWQTQSGDLQPPTAELPAVLTEPAPDGDYVVESRVRTTVPKTGCCHDYVQGGLLIYNDDANYIKLGSVSIGDTRQIEIGKHVNPQPGFPAYGNGVVGPAGEWTYLRLVSKACGTEQCYTAFSSLDGQHWAKGATWTQAVAETTRIGLISMAGSGFQSQFDYVRVTRLR